MELRRVLQGMPPMEGLGGGVGVGVPAGLSFGVWTGVPLGVGRGLPLGEGWGVTWMMGIDLVLRSELGMGWKWCSRIGAKGMMGVEGAESCWGVVRVARPTMGLLGLRDGWGWHGEEGSERALEIHWVSLPDKGLDLVACKGLSMPLRLVGRVWVFGHSRSGPHTEFGESEFNVGVWASLWSGESGGLVWGETENSTAWGGTQNFRRGYEISMHQSIAEATYSINTGTAGEHLTATQQCKNRSHMNTYKGRKLGEKKKIKPR